MYRRRMGWTFLLVVVAALFVSPVRADYETGQTAWQAGRHAEALAQWQAAAKTEDARAMLALGRAYVKGLGVPQDYVEAHKWLNLAAARGNAEAAAERGALAEKMTTEEQAEARRLARAWRSGGRVEPPKSAAVSSAAAPSAPTGPPPPRAIREAQGLLAALGYEPGPTDGRWGPRTGRAYSAFLRDAGLPPGNVLTPATLRDMRAVAKGRNVTAALSSPRSAPATQRKRARPAFNLHQLVAAGDVDRLKAAVEGGAEVNTRDGKGWTPLMHAADKGRSLLVPPLLKAGADPNIRASDGATALFIAALHENSEIAKALLNAGADPSITGPRGNTPAELMARLRAKQYTGRPFGLHEAIRAEESSAVIAALLKQGFNMEASDRDGWPPLFLAAISGNLKQVKLLLENGADLNARSKKGYDLLYSLAYYGDLKVEQEVLSVAKYLIDQGINLNAAGSLTSDSTAIGPLLHHLASSMQFPFRRKFLREFAEVFLSSGANVDIYSPGEVGLTPLIYSVWYGGDYDFVALLLKHGTDVNARWEYKNSGDTALHKVGAGSRRADIVKILIDNGANLRTRNYEGRTPLQEYRERRRNPDPKIINLLKGGES